MKVIELMHRANPTEVTRIYSETHKPDGWNSVESFNKFRTVLSETVGISEGEDQLKVVVQWIDHEWGGRDGKKYHDQYFSVGGRMIRDPGVCYSLSMTDWGVWREMEVEDESGKNLSIDELAAHVYYEITWFGWPEKMEQQRDKILDQVESINRFLDAEENSDGSLPTGFTLLGDFLDKFEKDLNNGKDS